MIEGRCGGCGSTSASGGRHPNTAINAAKPAT
jgi:hypothetical protein